MPNTEPKHSVFALRFAYGVGHGCLLMMMVCMLFVWGGCVSRNQQLSQADVHFQRARVLEQQPGREIDAEAEYRKAIQLDPRLSAAYNNLASLWFNQGLSTDAEIIATYKTALKLSWDFPEAHRNLALVLSRNPDHRHEALRHCQEAIRQRPSYWQAWEQLGDLLAQSREGYVDARAAYRQAVVLEPNNAALHFKIGLLCEKYPPWVQDAIAAYQQAITLDPRAAGARNNLSLLLRRQPGGVEQALATIEESVRIDPANVQQWVSLAVTRIVARQIDAAIDAANRAIALNPQAASAYFARGGAHIFQEDWDRALPDCRKAHELVPNNPDYAYILGHVLYRKDDWGAAIQPLTRAIELRPSNVDAFSDRSWCYKELGQVDMALADISEAIKLKPGKAWFWRRRGSLLAEKGNDRSAITDFSRSIGLDDSDFLSWYDRGEARMRMGDIDGAITDFDRTIALKPDEWLGYSARAQAKRKKRDYAGALADCNRMFEIEPEDAGNYRRRGIHQIMIGNFADGLADLEQFMARKEGLHAYEHFWRFLLQMRLGIAPDREGLAKVIATETNDWSRALAEFLGGLRSEDSLSDFYVSDKSAEHQCEALYYAGMLRLMEGDLVGARERFARCLELKITHFYEHDFAEAELHRMKPQPATNAE